MNKRRRKKAIQKLLKEGEYHLAVLGGKRRPRKRPPRLTQRERVIGEQGLAKRKEQPESN